jgi:anti-anti-sigma factor
LRNRSRYEFFICYSFLANFPSLPLTPFSQWENAREGKVMDLIVEVRTGRERVIMACHGKLVGGKEAEAFRRSALLLLGGFNKITINLAGVRTVDCGGLGSIAVVLAYAEKTGKQVRLTHASPFIVEMLKITRLADFLELGNVPPVPIAPAGHQAVA